MCAGLLGGAYTEGGLLHQAYGEGAEGRGVLETRIFIARFGNVRNPSLLCALAADRLVRGQITTTGVIHPASWLAPDELIRALIARAVTVRTRFLPEGPVPGTYRQVPWEEAL